MAVEAGLFLPPEVLELVLAQLPLRELLTNTALVCRLWRGVVCRPLFLPHRKQYWRYKLGAPGAREGVDALVTDGCGDTVQPLEHALPWILAHFSEPALSQGMDQCKGGALLPLLHLHSRYSLALALLKDRLPALASLPTTPLALLALILITATNVSEVSEALQLCLAPSSSRDSVLLVDLFYHLATLLLAMETKLSLPPRPHYLLFHALALYHASWTHDPSDRFTPRIVGEAATVDSPVPLTAEQRTIVNLPLAPLIGSRDTVRIVAYAGTGKTTTLVELCRRNPGVRFLLVVFNKAVALHSEKVFPMSNVTVKTANALSYRYIMKTEGAERFANWGMKYTDLIQHSGLMPHREMGKTSVWAGFSLYHRAAMVMKTLTNFYMSTTEAVTVEDTPPSWVVGKQARESREVSPAARQQLATDAWAVWKKVLAGYGGLRGGAKYDHDSSMKKFQLSRPVLSEWVLKVPYDYDVLLLDEAQDMNPAMLDICLGQNKPKIVVGDPHQQIYSFRGAVNALDLVNEHRETRVVKNCYLTQSFRYNIISRPGRSQGLLFKHRCPFVHLDPLR